MLAVWACREPATRRDIDEKLRSKGWAPATVLNFLYRLEEKGWVKSGKQGNHNIYAATVTQRAYGVWSMRSRSGSPYICAAPPFAFFFYICLYCSIIPGFVGKGKRQKSR